MHNEVNNINNCDRLKRAQQQVELCPLPLEQNENLLITLLQCGWKNKGTSNQHSIQCTISFRVKNEKQPQT